MEGCGRKIGPFDCCTVVVGDCLDVMAEIPNGCVGLSLTSPPYNVGKDYGETSNDSRPIEEYTAFIHDILHGLSHIAIIGGRIVVEVGGAGRGLPFDWIVQGAGLKAGLLFRGQVLIPHRATNRTAWGSYLCASNPYTIPNFHLAHMFSKDRHDRPELRNVTSPMSRSEWFEWTLGTWTVPMGRNIKHVPTFSEQFARRCILLLSGPSDLIFDPMIGSGTTAKSAQNSGHHFFGCDINPESVAMAEKSLSAVQLRMEI